MARIKVTPEKIEAINRAQDWKRVHAMTEEAIEASISSDPDAATFSDAELRALWVQRVRTQTGLSQPDFAKKFRIPVGTLRDWEQARSEPDTAVMAYLRVIEKHPEAVLDALATAWPDTAGTGQVILPAKAPTAGPTNFRNISTTDCPAVTDSVSISPSIAAPFGVSFEQACHRLSTLHRVGGARGAVLFPAGRSGGECVEAVLGGRVSVCALWWFVSPLGGAYRVFAAEYGAGQVQVAELPDGAAYLCFDCAVAQPVVKWGQPRPVHVAAMGCALANAGEVVYARRSGPGRGVRRHRPGPAGCAIAPTAAAAHFRRWNTGCRWIP
jgi:putative transcriptional regulator